MYHIAIRYNITCQWMPSGHTGLTIKAIDLCNLPTLVVPPQQSDTIRILGFHTEQLGKCLQTIVASVHKITL